MAAYAPRRSSAPVLRSSTPNRRCSAQTPSSSSSSLPRVNLFASCSLDRTAPTPQAQKRSCMCSPTNHPGSFRCSLHKAAPRRSETASCGNSGRLNMRRSAMKNSLVRIGTVEGEWVKRALAALIRPSSHHQRRRGEFRPRPSRLSVMARSGNRLM